MKSPLDRRAFLVGGAAASASLLAPAALADSTLRPATDARSRGAKGDGTTDDTAALQKAIAALPPGGTLFLARGKYLIHDTLDLARGTSLIGEQLGTTIVVKQLDRPAVRTASESNIAHLTFSYPGNRDLVNPKPARETISLAGGAYLQDITFDCAFIGVGTPPEGANCGQSVIRHLNGFVHDTMVRIDGSLDLVRIENVHCFVPTDQSDRNYYVHHRKCFHILRSDGTIISKSFMIQGSTFLLKEIGATGPGLATHLSECWCEAMVDHVIRATDATRITLSQCEFTSANAKALVELSGGARAMMTACYLRDSANSTGVVVGEGCGLTLSASEIFGTPGFTAVVLRSSEASVITGNYIHHCEVGIRCEPEADQYVISGNHLSQNNQPMVLNQAKHQVVNGNL
jgi:hypothetical protein